MAVSISDIVKQLEAVESEALPVIREVATPSALQETKARYLGKKSALRQAFSQMGKADPAQRKELGQALNRLQTVLEEAVARQQQSLGTGAGGEESFDSSLPGRALWVGHKHPLGTVMDEIRQIFVQLGFETAIGPEVEDDWHNFEALNTPPHHPARDMQDTFYVSDEIVLRTHTSPVQIRLMEARKPPLRAIMPGRVFRNEEISARSYCLFHQVEGLYVDRNVTFGDLKGTISCFVQRLFGAGTRSKFRPSFFPFTEPSAEVDIECFLCKGKGCSICKQTGWLEVMGCGMVDPNVFDAVGIDNEEFTGFAFGMGLERIAMLKFGINDIRLFFENDRRFLEQF